MTYLILIGVAVVLTAIAAATALRVRYLKRRAKRRLTRTML